MDPYYDVDDAVLAAEFRMSVALSDSESPRATMLPLPALDDADPSLWNLISPYSDVDELHEFEDHDDDPPEPESSPHHSSESKPEEEEEEAHEADSSDEDDDEIEVFPVDETVRGRASSVESEHMLKEEPLESVTDADDMDPMDALSSSTSSSQWMIDDSASEDGSVTTSRPSLPGQWVRRMKARTYSGPASMKMHEAYDKLRARTLSATATLRQAARARNQDPQDHEDDGGFSSDDEDYDHTRASRVSTPGRAMNLSFSTKLNHMQLPTKMSSMLRFRTSSSATTSSEDSLISSSYGSSLDSTLSGGATDPKPVTTTTSYSRQELKNKATVAATRAAGLLGAASAEAARKLRTTRAFRSPSHPSMAAPSPVVDREENSPERPPLPTHPGVASRP